MYVYIVQHTRPLTAPGLQMAEKEKELREAQAELADTLQAWEDEQQITQQVPAAQRPSARVPRCRHAAWPE